LKNKLKHCQKVSKNLIKKLRRNGGSIETPDKLTFLALVQIFQ